MLLNVASNMWGSTLGNVQAAVAIMLFATLAGCISVPDYAQYEDSIDYYASTDRYESVSFSIDTTGAARITSDGLRSQFASYLSQYGISTVEEPENSNAHVELALRDTQLHRPKTNYSGESDRLPYSIDARVISDGKIVADTTLHYVALSTDTPVVQQQLASMIADDLFLIWHPRSSARWLTTKSGKPAPFALIQNDVEPQTAAGETRFTWEAFPSDRILEDSGLSRSDISDIEYEVRLQHTQLKEVAFSHMPYSDHAEVFLGQRIEEPSYIAPFVMPSCDNLIWSVRAHFKLSGYPRVTEWAGYFYNSFGMTGMNATFKSTLPPHIYRRSQDTKAWQNLAGSRELMHHSRVGTVSEVVPPNRIECKELDWGVLDVATKRAQGDFDGQIHALAQGEAVGASAVVHRQCSTDNCEFETGTEDVTGQLVSCLSREFDRRSMDTPVLGVSDAESSPQNVRYILDSKINLVEGKTVYDGDSNVIGTVWGKNTAYSATFETNVIDTATGEVVGEINSAHQGSKGQVAGFFLILPIMYFPYGSISEIQNKACDELARYTSFVLRGGVSKAWPDQYFKTESDALW